MECAFICEGFRTPIGRYGGALAQVRALWEACGARVSAMTAEDHDRVLAAVSHLPHLLAFVLVAEIAARPDGADVLERAGSGFRDFTRIAASSAEMWRDVMLANRDAILAELDRYRAALDDAHGLLAASDGPRLADVFGRAAAARRSLDDASE